MTAPHRIRDPPQVPALRIANDYAQLAFHALAHVPIAGPSCLYDARYVAWCREALPSEAWEPIARDAELVGRAHDAGERSMRLQWLPLLYADFTAFRRDARLAFSELSEVASPRAKAALAREDPVALELLRGAMLLAAPAYAGSWPRAACVEALGALGPALEEARGLSSALAARDVALVFALGPRGRALDGVIFVGAPGDFAQLSAAHAAVIALHEASVVEAGGDYVHAEWRGLEAGARALIAGSRALREAHATWLAGLSFDALAEAAAARGLVTRARAERVVTAPTERAALFAMT